MQLMRISVTLPPEKWLLIAVDQTLHILLLAGAAIALGRG
jgi:hypothetical protein